MFYLLLFMLFIFVQSNYFTSNKILTKYTNKQQIINILTDGNFYEKYLNIVEASEVEFNPKITDLNKEIQFPFEVSYISTPKINFLPNSLTRLKINQSWNRNKDTFLGHIKTNYLEFNISIHPVFSKTHKKCMIIFNGVIIKKNILIPNSILDNILNDFGNIFLKFD